MSAPLRKRRQPTAATMMALEVIATSASCEIRRNDFELLMHQRGCDARQVAQALVSLERRGWVSATDSMVMVSEDGHLAATQGVGLPATPRKRPRRRERMPSGLL